MTHDEKEIKRKLRILQHAEYGGNIAKTCRYFGVARSAFYLWRNAYREFGEAGLKRKRPVPKSHPRRTPPEIEEKVLYLFLNKLVWNFFKLLPVILLPCMLPASATDKEFKVPRFVPPYLDKLRSHYSADTVQVGDSPVWLIKNPANQMSNAVLIEGKKALVVFDTGASRDHGAAILAEIRKISDKPITALIYSHHHGDHCTGAGAIVDRHDVDTGRVRVIARDNFMREYVDEDFMTGPIQSLRSIYQFGGALQEQDLEDYVIGIGGGVLPSGPGAFIEPNTFIDRRQTLALADITFEFILSGGESATHMIVWLPRWKIVLSGDEVYPALPNLHALRGTKFRDARNWIRAVDLIRQLQPEFVAPSHGSLMSDRNRINKVLTIYRDAIQYQHDQAIRFINKGYTASELGEQLNGLPAYLKLRPYTEEMYGKLGHNIPNIFHGYVSWFSGDAVDLAPTPRRQFAERIVTLMGGRDVVYNEAKKSFEQDDPQFTAELATYLLRVNPEDSDASRLKAASYRQLGYQQINSIWRSWYLTAALELEGRFDVTAAWKELMSNVRGSGNLSGLPTVRVLELLRYNVAAELMNDTSINLRWHITDHNENLYTELRRGILEISEQPLSTNIDASVNLNRKYLDALVAGELELITGIKQGFITTTGNRQKTEEFFRYIEPLNYDISLSAR